MPLKPEFVELFADAVGKVMAGDIGPLEENQLIADLSLDSVALLDLINLLEEKMGAPIDDRKLSELRTVGDLERLLEIGQKPG